MAPAHHSTRTLRNKLTLAALLAAQLMVVVAVAPAQNVALSALGTVHPGFRIDGIDANDFSGFSVSGAGDVNGDGLADLIVGAYYADPNGAGSAGESYVVFGKTGSTAVSLAGLGAGGFRIDGIDAYDRSGNSVSGAGDVNGDGLADLIVGANGADPNSASTAGESYVVFGKTDSMAVNLAGLGAGGFRIDGIGFTDHSGRSVSGAGDVNGDGLADLIIGAQNADPNGISNAGESYVIFSAATPPATANYKATAPAGNAPEIAVGQPGDGSSTPDARAGIDFADGATPSTQTVRLMRNNNELTNLTNGAEVAWEITSDRTVWTTGRVTFKYLDSEIAGLDEGALRVFKSASASGPWTPLPNITRNPANNTISGDVTSFSYFAIAENVALAVELGEFKATVVAAGVEVKWTTLIEDETAGFFIRRAIPTGAGGTTVGERINTDIIPAEGGGSYSVVDEAGTQDSLYYLEEITVDGSTKYYGPVGASTRNSSVGEWMAF